jgi:AraC family transcriptional regulator
MSCTWRVYNEYGARNIGEQLMHVRNLDIGDAGGPQPALCAPTGTTRTVRRQVLESKVGLVENLRCAGQVHEKSPEGFSPHFQVCLPYRGLFVWHVGHDDIVADANQVLFVSGGESYHLSQPRSAEYAELIVTPDLELLAEIADARGTSLTSHPLFRRRSCRIDFQLQKLRMRFLNSAMWGDCNDLAAEESMISLLRCALKIDGGGFEAGRPTRRLIGRAKQFLEGNMASPLRLADVATAVGASPAYLTDAFRRVEGVPLHRYLTQLRLARALVELPHASDLTTLALGLGFSSHSHFTAVFRRAFNCTPSCFRESSRKQSVHQRRLPQ